MCHVITLTLCVRGYTASRFGITAEGSGMRAPVCVLRSGFADMVVFKHRCAVTLQVLTQRKHAIVVAVCHIWSIPLTAIASEYGAKRVLIYLY